MTAFDWILLGMAAVLVVAVLVKRLRQVPAARARELMRAGALVLDVRTGDEFARGHAPGAVNLPLEQVRRRIADLEPDRSRPILVYCRSGVRSAMGCRILRGLGYGSVHDLGSHGRVRRMSRGVEGVE